MDQDSGLRRRFAPRNDGRQHLSIRVDHDLHGLIKIVERIRETDILDQRDAAQADVAVDDGERDRLEALAFAGAGVAQAGVDLERRAMTAAAQQRPVGIEELAAADVQPFALVRARIDIADEATRSGVDDDDRKRPRLAIVANPRQAERLRLAPRKARGGTDDEDFGLTFGHARHSLIDATGAAGP